MIEALLATFTGLTLIYSASTGKTWEPFYAWLGTLSLIVSIKAEQQARRAKVASETVLLKEASSKRER